MRFNRFCQTKKLMYRLSGLDEETLFSQNKNLKN